MDDQALVERLKCGDQKAVEYVVLRYVPAIYRFAYYQLQDAFLAEDLASDVMARMIGNIEGFIPGAGSFHSWLFRIARNLIADHYRARKRRPQISLEGWLHSKPMNEPGCNDPEIEGLVDQDQLRMALATLTSEQREVILLHVVEGWQLPEVAMLLDLSLSSVKSLYYRGIQSLRRAMAADAQHAG